MQALLSEQVRPPRVSSALESVRFALTRKNSNPAERKHPSSAILATTLFALLVSLVIDIVQFSLYDTHGSANRVVPLAKSLEPSYHKARTVAQVTQTQPE